MSDLNTKVLVGRPFAILTSHKLNDIPPYESRTLESAGLHFRPVTGQRKLPTSRDTAPWDPAPATEALEVFETEEPDAEPAADDAPTATELDPPLPSPLPPLWVWSGIGSSASFRAWIRITVESDPVAASRVPSIFQSSAQHYSILTV